MQGSAKAEVQLGLSVCMYLEYVQNILLAGSVFAESIVATPFCLCRSETRAVRRGRRTTTCPLARISAPLSLRSTPWACRQCLEARVKNAG